MQRAKRANPELPKHLGIDETSFQKRHEYVTVVCDQEKGNVVHVADGRSAGAVEEYLKGFEEKARAAVQTVAMDMWQAYVNAVERLIPGSAGKICFDKFHMAQHLGKAVDKVRREEHRRRTRNGDATLKGYRHLWLANPANLIEERLAELETLRGVAEKTGRAWALKETVPVKGRCVAPRQDAKAAEGKGFLAPRAEIRTEESPFSAYPGATPQEA